MNVRADIAAAPATCAQWDELTTRAIDVPSDWPNRAFSRRIDAGGATWHVQRMGRGPRILLIHGTAASTHTWRDVMPRLARSCDVLAVDLPGHAFTTRLPDQSMSLPSLARATGDLLEAVEFRPRCIVGHSAGAAIGLRAVLDGAARPRVLVGLNAALLPFGGALRTFFAPMAQLFATTRLMPRMLAQRARDIDAVRRVLHGTGSELDAYGLALYQRLFQREQHLAAVLAMMASWDLRPLVHEMPGLGPELHLVTGTLDKAISPREAESVARIVPRTRITQLDELGHLAHEERPESVADLVARSVPADEVDNDD